MKPSDFDQIRENMKARKISGAQIARETGRSSSQINNILRGDYPYYRGYGLPKYLYEYLVSMKLLVAENGTYLIQAKPNIAHGLNHGRDGVVYIKNIGGGTFVDADDPRPASGLVIIDDLHEEIETVICARCGEEYPAESKECTSCGLSRVGRFKDDDENSGVPA